ncbi:MAG: hypothetical protein ACKPCM_10070 [Pseudanabaena sp.]
METSTQIKVSYYEEKANEFDQPVLEASQKYGGKRVFGWGRIELSIEKQPAPNTKITAFVKTATFEFPNKESGKLFLSELSEFNEITTSIS